MSRFETRIEEVGESHVTAYAALSRSEYGEALIAQPLHLRWKYLQKPGMRPIGVHLYDGVRLIGRVAVWPQMFDGVAGSFVAAYIVDLLIDPAFRGVAPLVALVRGIESLRDRFDFIFVTPNDAGEVVWQKLARLTKRYELKVAAVPLRPSKLARAIAMPKAPFTVTPIDPPARMLLKRGAAWLGQSRLTFDDRWPSEHEIGLLATNGTPSAVAGRRDRAFLEWRFKQSPIARYDSLFLRLNAELVGYVISRRYVYAGYDARFIVDAQGTEKLTSRDWLSVVWALIDRELQSDGADLLIVIANTTIGAIASFGRFPFISVPRRLLPQHTAVFANWWSVPKFDFDPSSFALTLADCDMI